MKRPASFDAELVDHLPMLRRIAASRVPGEAAHQDDLVQQTVVSALTHWDQFQPGTNFKGWLKTILQNVLRMELRAFAAHGPTQFHLNEAGAEVELERLADERSARSPEARSDLRLVIGCVSPKLVGVLLDAGYGYDYEEMRARAHLDSCGTVKSRLNRARVQASAALAKAHAVD